MNNFSIKSFLAGCFLTALILIPLFYFYFLPNHYYGLRADIDSNRRDIDMVLEHQPYFNENAWYLIRKMDQFEANMDEREKMILTRDMPSEIEVEISPSEGD